MYSDPKLDNFIQKSDWDKMTKVWFLLIKIVIFTPDNWLNLKFAKLAKNWNDALCTLYIYLEPCTSEPKTQRLKNTGCLITDPSKVMPISK